MNPPDSNLTVAGPHVRAKGALSCALLIALLASSVLHPFADEGKIDLSRIPPSANRPVDYTEIEPLLKAHCYACHGPDKQKSGLRLDQKSSVLKGGERGPALLPGKSADSLLVQAAAGAIDDLQMPPRNSAAKPLSVEEIAIVRAWIDQGAKWPESSETPAQAKEDYWVFRPSTRPALPVFSKSAWPRNEVDQFILARLQQEGLAPAAEADKRTLVRRVCFDLLGLPPTPEQLHAFLSDTREDAYEQMVDRVLSSPRYGERWARYWLDTVHYGETHGYDKDKPRTNAWPYRDYVIKAFNDDKPYSRFVREQLAGDVLYPADPDGVIALGFIAAGPWDFVGHVELPESKTDGLIARYNDRDDMVMTAMSTFQSLTVHCARCHDHKFDPISQEDYYSLQAVFAGVDRADRPFDSDPAVFQTRQRLLQEKKQLGARRKAIDDSIAQLSPEIFRVVESRKAELARELASLKKAAASESPSNGYHSEVSSKQDEVKWVQIDLGKAVPLDEIRLYPARPTDFADSPGFGFPLRFKVEGTEQTTFEQAHVLLDQSLADVPNPGDKPVIVPVGGRSVRLIRVTANRLWLRTADYVFALGELEASSGGQNVASGGTVTALDSIESGRWSKRALVDGYDSRKRLGPAEKTEEQAARLAAVEAEFQKLDAEKKALVEKLLAPSVQAESASISSSLEDVNRKLSQLPSPRTVFAAAHDFSGAGSFHPAVTPRPVFVLKRGEVTQPLRPAAPGSISCVPGMPARFKLAHPEDEGARRAALAEWITDPKNLLTRRSIVNRVWQYHFGKGIIDTPNDFGHMGALPSHPELLDWLACWFLDHGESVKQLHRLLLTSATYRQSSREQSELAKKDNDNRFLWRMNRSRLDAEAIRDSILYVAGRLDLTMGGPSVQQFFFKDDHSPIYDYSRFDPDTPAAMRRSVYRFIVRSVPDPLMETLDCPDPSLLAPKRSATVTALQALVLLNDPLVLRQSEYFAERVRPFGPALQGQIEAAYELALSRSPSPEETQKLAAYAESHGMANLCRLIFNSNEFVFVD